MKYGTWKSRQGSALLIVLGMFSFMLVSAVAFSIYMRASRAPSSYVRRNSSARHLAKAAIARAMDEIDCAIGNDPFPGVGFNHNYGGSGLNDSDEHRNDNWHGHVFTPSNEVAAAKTVSTLSLEALGYLPPCLIDEVRYWSRHSRTAKWHSFNYGMGQYAFTAVNVSDFFDINQFRNEESGDRKPYLNRNSAPHGRISPTYLFRGNLKGDMDSGGAAASAFLNVVADGSGLNMNPSISEVPFVSMMDFNLALGGAAPGGIASPFYNRINGGTGRFYSGNAGEDVVRRQVFMAGGWNAESNLSYSAYNTLGRINLRYPEYQPFAGYSWFPDATTLSHCYNDVDENHPFWQTLNENFPVLATALLCDYLDYDKIPLSLCIPCTEAVPMICGVELNDKCVKCTTDYVVGPTVPGGTPQNPLDEREDICKLNITVDFNPIITVAYPFLYDRTGVDSYEIECYARIFFEEEQNTGDSDITDSGLRNAFFNLGSLDSTWSSLKSDGGGSSFLEVKCKTTLRISEFSNRGLGREREATVSKPLRGTISASKELAKLKFVGPPGAPLPFSSATDSMQIDFFPKGDLDASRRVDFATSFMNQGGALTYRPMVAMWVRIIDKNGDSGKTVDMSPAVPAYDTVNDFSGNETLNRFNAAATGSAPGGSEYYPAFRFFPNKASSSGVVPDRSVGGPFDGLSGAPTPVSVEPDWKQKAYVANDPRINWAPEQWWATDQTSDPRDLWVNNVDSFCSADIYRDQDIFMSVSDQGYLQSMYEWMMIPQVRSLTISSSAEWGAFEGGNGYNGVVRTGIGNVLHRDLMWRTYRSDAFGVDSGWGSIDNLPFDDADNGLRVNPYTDIMNVMLGAFANMPRDWWAASTNHLADGKNYMAPGSSTFEDKYLFDWSCNYQDVYNMAYYWMGAFKRWDLPANEERGKKLYENDNWKDVFEDAIDWRRGDTRYDIPIVTSDSGTIDTGILNVNTAKDILQDLTFAERKYLYGYLKGCFANNSQLFLIFVRAESAAGGGGAGSGARAVALVWRDPAAPRDASGNYKKADGGTESPTYGKDNGRMYLNTENNSNGAEETWRLNKRNYPPHKMRVLFYHQLD